MNAVCCAGSGCQSGGRDIHWSYGFGECCVCVLLNQVTDVVG